MHAPIADHLAPSDHSARIRRHGEHRRIRPLTVAVPVNLAWVGVALAANSGAIFGRSAYGLVHLLGYGLIAIDFTGAATSIVLGARSKREGVSTTGTRTVSADANVDSPAPFEHRCEDRPMIARAALALLESRLETGEEGRSPTVQLVRVGITGVELLLSESFDAPPSGFTSDDGGLVWRLQATSDLDTDEVLGRPDRVSELIALGEDDESTFFAGPGLDDPPLCDELPSSEKPDTDHRLGRGVMLVASERSTILEPFGLELLPIDPLPFGQAADETRTADHSDVPIGEGPEDPTNAENLTNAVVPSMDKPEPASFDDAYLDDSCLPVSRLENAAEKRPADPLPFDFLACGTPKETVAPFASGYSAVVDQSEATESIATDLIAPGRVEIRILCEEPELVGAVLREPSPAAIEFVAYLALHRHRATTARLRDSIGTLKMQASRSGKTIWAAASAARDSIGIELLPRAAGNHLYELSSEVTCDWLRFHALFTLAANPEVDQELCHRALAQALALVDGIPASASRRFTWLDHEGLLEEITKAVSDAAVMLATLEIEADTPESAGRTIEKGLLFSPDDDRLADLRRQLNDGRP